jgi:hypothetical protein
VRPGAERRLDALHAGAEVFRGLNDRGGHQPVFDESLLVVHVVDEQIQRCGPLDEPRLDLLPFLAGDGARDDVERPGAVDRAVLLVVDRERDAHGLDRELGRLLPNRDLVAVHLGQVAHERAARDTCAAAGAYELVVAAGGRV